MRNTPSILRFGPYELDEARLELRRHGTRVRIQGKPLAVLRYLVRHGDRVVPHAELLQHVWAGARVEPGVLKSAVHALRRALAGGAERTDDPDSDGTWIASIHGQGYRFIGALHDGPRASATGRAAGASDFVGREPELAELRRLCRAALDGQRRQIALIGGAPAVGKTRLAMELAREAEVLGFETHVGRTHGGAGAPPFWPWAQIVRGWMLVHGPERLAEIAAASGPASELLGLAGPPADPGSPCPPGPVRFRTFERTSRFLAGASRERPQLLILDDLHRADTASLELLGFLSQYPLDAPLVVLATHRPLEPDHPLARLLPRPGTHSIPLRALERDAVAKVLAASLGDEPAPGLVQTVLLRSGGNPLFVQELARALGAGAPLDAPVPARVHDAVRARICECSAASLQVLCLASVADADLTLPLLHEALGAELGGAALLAALAEAEQRDLLSFRGGSYRFVHGIVRETLRARLGATEQDRLLEQLDAARDALCAPPRTGSVRRAHLPRARGDAQLGLGAER
jgi:DNA-binding winged helix-turn-helix (wHTH) protein